MRAFALRSPLLKWSEFYVGLLFSGTKESISCAFVMKHTTLLVALTLMRRAYLAQSFKNHRHRVQTESIIGQDNINKEHDHLVH